MWPLWKNFRFWILSFLVFHALAAVFTFEYSQLHMAKKNAPTTNFPVAICLLIVLRCCMALKGVILSAFYCLRGGSVAL